MSREKYMAVPPLRDEQYQHLEEGETVEVNSSTGSTAVPSREQYSHEEWQLLIAAAIAKRHRTKKRK